MSVRRRGDNWMVDFIFCHPDGRKERFRKLSPVQTRRGAEEYERQVRESLLDGSAKREEERSQEPTLSEFAARFLEYSETNNKPSAVYAKRWILKNHLEPAFGAKRVGEISAADVESYKAAKVKGGQSPKSINNHLAVLRKLLNLAVEWGELSHSPKLKALRVPQQDFDFLTFEEEPRFLAAVEKRRKAMAVVAVKTGLRLGELLALQWKDVDLNAGRMMVRRNRWNGQEGTPKSGRAREVPLSESALSALRSHRHLMPYVFCHADGTPLAHYEVKNVVPAACRAAGLAKRLTWHDLRHTFASHLVMRGVPLKAVQELMGHATIDMTMRYAHLSPDVKRDAVKLLDSAWHHCGTGSSGNEKPQGVPGVS